MERALNPELLALALGQQSTLPSAEELSSLIAGAELSLLLGNLQVDQTLISTGWYLHAVASSKYALRVYGLARQRAAFAISANIFDLVTRSQDLNTLDKLKYGFASQIAYLRSELNPNAVAIYQQEFSANLPAYSLIESFQEAALSCGIAFLGFDASYIFPVTRRLRDEATSLVANWEVSDIFVTPLGSAAGVALGTRALMGFLVYGRNELLDNARRSLENAIFSQASADDQLSRWVAAHLLNLLGDLQSSSVWHILPPELPPSVKRAFAMGTPRVLTLWPPQINLLTPREESPSPLSENVKRLFLSMPTSSGKTLLAQLLVASHLATQATSVYYVAPTRSLCREIRLVLESRLRYLGRVITNDLPEGDWLDEFITTEPHVEVMTPERLSFLLRSDSDRVLAEVGLFIFDEVHNIADPSRGWTFEQDLAYLHYRTSGQHHRIVSMSAAIGNQAHIVQWMGEDNNSFVHCSSDWRGPRRIHAIFTTDVDWNALEEIEPKSKRALKRKSYPVFGRLDVRIAQNGKDAHLRTANPVGRLVRKIREDNTEEHDPDASTPQYRMLIPIIQHLADTGAVLIIESTRLATVRMAKALAEDLPIMDPAEIKTLLDLVESRLGIQHPLWGVLQKGVAYHHGSLPSEIRIAIEGAVTAGDIKYLVATTTMTEGVNLPVKSVVIAEQGIYTAAGYTEIITGSKLINAIGRAGRATKETEGVIVLARRERPTPADFDLLDPNEEELQVVSNLATKEALDELASFEESQRANEDAIFEIADGVISGFLSFIWFLSSEIEALHAQDVTLAQIKDALRFTLAWVQLPNDQKEKWLQVADIVLQRFKSTNQQVRRRWAASGSSMSSASKMENIATSLANALPANTDVEDPVKSLEFILADGRLAQILTLPEAPKRSVFAQRGGKSRRILSISLEKILYEWISGLEPLTIAENHLSQIADVDFRFEQLGDLINEYFENFLPWVCGTIVEWTNEKLLEQGRTALLPKTIPAYIRWGVGNPPAADLMSRGLSSRNLAMRIANSWLSESRAEDIFTWLRSLGIPDWQQQFGASPSEMRLLLEFCRDQKGGAAVDLVNNGTTSIKFDTTVNDFQSSHVHISPLENTDLAPYGIYATDELVGKIFTKDQADIRSILSLGIDYLIDLSVKSGVGTLQISLAAPDV